MRRFCASPSHLETRRIPGPGRAGRAGLGEHGALEYREWIADDVKPGEHTSFPQSVKLEDGETVILAWAVYESRSHRDAVLEKVMQDPRLADMMKPGGVPFDGKRMFFGGFDNLIDL